MKPLVAPAITARPAAEPAGLRWYALTAGLRSARGAGGRRVTQVYAAAREVDAKRAEQWLAERPPAAVQASGPREARRLARARARAIFAAPATESPAAPAAAVEQSARRGRRVAFVAAAPTAPEPKERPMPSAAKTKDPKHVAAKKPKGSPASPAVADPQADLRAARLALDVAEEKAERGYNVSLEDEQALERARENVAACEVSVMPMPPAMGLKFEEADVDVALIESTGNHRERIDDAQLRQLARSIQVQGLQQRIGICARGGGYELIFGARRLAAAKLAGLAEIPAKVYPHSITAAQVEILRTIENVGRQEITPAERAIAVARTIEAIEGTLGQLGGETPGGNQQAVELESEIAAAGGLLAYVGQQLGYSAKWVQDHAYVAKLGGAARALLSAGRITIAHARELAKLGDKDAADDIADRVARWADGTHGEGVEACRKYVVERLRSLRGVGWRLEVAFGKGVEGCTGYACTTCPFNSKTDPDLFGGVIADEPEAGTCTNEACFKAKTEIAARDGAKVVAKLKPKVEAGKAEATESAVAAMPNLPTHLRPSTVARKLKKETTPTAATPSASVASSSASSSKRTPEEIAEQKLQAALDKHRDVVEESMKSAVDADPTGRLVTAMALLLQVRFDGFKWGRGKGATEDDVELLRMAADPARLPELAAAAIKDDEWADQLFQDLDWDAATLQIFVDAWSLSVPPVPTLADFLPKPKAEKPDRRAWVDRMSACTTAGQARELFSELDAAINALQRKIGVTPTVGEIDPKHHVGFSVVKSGDWKKAIVAARKRDPAGADALGDLVQQGTEIHGKPWTTLYAAEHVERQAEEMIEPGEEFVRLGGKRLATAPGWQKLVESIDQWPDLSAEALEAASQLVRIAPPNPRDDAPLMEKVATSTVGPILRAGGVEFAVTFSRHDRDRVVYELHPLASGTHAVYDDWLALRTAHPKCAPEEIPLAGLRVETSSGFARAIANDLALLVEVRVDRPSAPREAGANGASPLPESER